MEDGFRLSADHIDPISNPPNFKTAGILNENYFGSTAPWHHISTGTITLTNDNGAVFSVRSVTLAELPNRTQEGDPINFGPFDIEFVGTRNNGSQVSETVTVDSFITLAPYDLSALTGLVAVTWAQGAGGSGVATHMFDDILVVVGCCADNECDDGDPCNGIESCAPSGACDTSLNADCNGNLTEDACDIAQGTSLDCQSNGVPDECELGGNDCNADSIPDDRTCAGAFFPCNFGQ